MTHRAAYLPDLGVRGVLHWGVLCVKYLPSAFLSFEFRGYVQSAAELVSGKSIHDLKGLDMTYKTTLCMISLDIAFNSYRRVNMEFTNAEIRAILKFSFVKGKSARETFREINGVLGDSEPVKTTPWISHPAEDL
ncbi:uncharacterized protein [Atheta coriaria]|uniref:uncharacterized protein n=1 Tax=Dalotia coriaria TaxID=877792 RepID=UPI0031F473D0